MLGSKAKHQETCDPEQPQSGAEQSVLICYRRQGELKECPVTVSPAIIWHWDDNESSTLEQDLARFYFVNQLVMNGSDRFFVVLRVIDPPAFSSLNDAAFSAACFWTITSRRGPTVIAYG